MVAFCDPRKSRIDIVQAVGRAMRKPRAGAKTLGYVVVPILLAPHQADDLEEGARNTEWEDIVDVLAALREHDTRLEDLIQDAQVAKGRGEVFNPRVFAERVQVVGPFVSLDVLERHVGAVVLERLGTSWDVRYGELVAYRAQHGDCDVPVEYPKHPPLGIWCDTQRQRRRHGTLSADRARRLDELVFVWAPQDHAWEEMFGALVTYKARYGDCNVPEHLAENRRLAKWLPHQLRFKKRGTLSADRVRRLEALGVAWDRRDATWEQRFAELAAFRKREGHFGVPRAQYRLLATWLAGQRRLKASGRLSAERTRRLDEVGCPWEPHDAKWEQRFIELVAFRAQHGHCTVPHTYPENPPLGV